MSNPRGCNAGPEGVAGPADSPLRHFCPDGYTILVTALCVALLVFAGWLIVVDHGSMLASPAAAAEVVPQTEYFPSRYANQGKEIEPPPTF